MKLWKTTLMTALAATLATTGCSQKIAFSGQPDEAGKNATPSEPICETGETTMTKPTKFILVVDQSGSNWDGPTEHDGIGTDPDKARRFGAISEFFLLHGQKPHVSWSFIGFAGAGAKALTSDGTEASPVFAGFVQMLAALAKFKDSKDDGVTPYLAGLKMAKDLIAKDLAAGVPEGTQYRIAFLTDGYPTDYPAGAQLESAIDAGIQAVVDLAPEAIQMSTVYYGFPDATASARLQRMSVQGKGQFLDAGNSEGLHLGDVIQVPKPSCN